MISEDVFIQSIETLQEEGVPFVVLTLDGGLIVVHTVQYIGTRYFVYTNRKETYTLSYSRIKLIHS